MSKMTLKEALALRLPNGTRLGDASPDELEAEAARLATVAEAIKNGTPETTTRRIERQRIASLNRRFASSTRRPGGNDLTCAHEFRDHTSAAKPSNHDRDQAHAERRIEQLRRTSSQNTNNDKDNGTKSARR